MKRSCYTYNLPVIEINISIIMSIKSLYRVAISCMHMYSMSAFHGLQNLIIKQLDRSEKTANPGNSYVEQKQPKSCQKEAQSICKTEVMYKQLTWYK